MSAPQFPYAPHGAPTHVPTSNGMATAGFVLSLIGLLTCWIPILNILGIILALLGIVLAAVGLAKAQRVRTGKGLAITGIVLGVLAVIFAIMINVAFTDAVDDAIDDNDPDVPSSTVGASPDSKSSADEGSTTGDAAAFKDGVLTTPEMKIVITKHAVISPGARGNEYGDKPVIAFWYEITNLSGQDTSPMDWIFVLSAFQDNNPNAENELEIAGLPDDRFLDTQMENIKKGGTVENAVAYELDDTHTPVELVANDSLGFSDDLGRVTYKLK